MTAALTPGYPCPIPRLGCCPICGGALDTGGQCVRGDRWQWSLVLGTDIPAPAWRVVPTTVVETPT